jgi:hypothetical protein
MYMFFIFLVWGMANVSKEIYNGPIKMAPYKGGICFLVTPPPRPPFFNGGAPQIINTNNNMSYYGVSLPTFIIKIKQNGIN